MARPFLAELPIYQGPRNATGFVNREHITCIRPAWTEERGYFSEVALSDGKSLFVRMMPDDLNRYLSIEDSDSAEARTLLKEAEA